jgi:EmrB/QacA subfamily drug resistance transporter
VDKETTHDRILVDTNQKWWILVSIGIGSFMSALDGSVVNIALPVIGVTFKTNVASLEWVVTIYLLVISSALLSFGRLGDMRGHKNIYLLGFIIFVSSSALCGLTPNVPILIAFRATQALGGAMLSSNAPAILTKSFPASQRGQALGLQATMTYLGLTVGPSLGGWLTNQFSWRAVFYINVPVGLLALWFGWRYIQSDRVQEQSEQFDLSGAATFMFGLIALLLGLNQGQAWGWTSPAILTLFGVAIVLLSIFLKIEGSVLNPMLDLRLFGNRVFSLSVFSAIINYVCVYTILFLMPFYLIDGRALNPAHAGLLLTAQPIVMAIVAPISGTLSDRIGVRLPGMLGMAMLAVGLFFLSKLGASTPFPNVITALALVGFGTGVFISPNNSALLGSAPRHRQGIAAGMLATARNFGMVLGVGFAGAVFTTVQAIHTQAGPSVALIKGFQVTFMIAAVIASIGVITSAGREKEAEIK